MLRRFFLALSVLAVIAAPAVGLALPVYVSPDGTDNGVFLANSGSSYSVDVYYNLDSAGGGAYGYNMTFTSDPTVTMTGFAPSGDVGLWSLVGATLSLSGGDQINGQSGTFLLGTLDFDAGALAGAVIGSNVQYLGLDFSNQDISSGFVEIVSAPIPEPGTALLLGAGILALAARRRN